MMKTPNTIFICTANKQNSKSIFFFRVTVMVIGVAVTAACCIILILLCVWFFFMPSASSGHVEWIETIPGKVSTETRFPHFYSFGCDDKYGHSL
jgi:hypothetical protein